jgi:alcohol dehydrogenase class IV
MTSGSDPDVMSIACRSMSGFTWQDGERVIHFGRGRLAEAAELLPDGYVLLTTERAQDAAPEVAERAADVHFVGPGLVDELSAELLPRIGGDGMLVALGGGRVIDTAKAIGGATGRPAGAIPTTLSAAEMTKVHRTPKAVEGARRIRAALVLNDPALCASQPPAELAASAANSLAHAVEGASTTMASPVPSLAAHEAMRLTDVAYAGEGPEEDVHRDQLALAALLSGYAIDAAGYGLHHVMSQTLVRVGGAGHGPANAAMLPHTIAALEQRRPGYVDPDGSLRELARTLAQRAGAAEIRKIGVEHDRLADCARAAAQRAELAFTPPAAGEAELLELYENAW